jgi:putative ABC transport system permease protein
MADGAVATPRFRAQLVSAFSMLAMSIAGIGLFSVIAFSVRQRAREFGVRMARGRLMSSGW